MSLPLISNMFLQPHNLHKHLEEQANRTTNLFLFYLILFSFSFCFSRKFKHYFKKVLIKPLISPLGAKGSIVFSLHRNYPGSGGIRQSNVSERSQQTSCESFKETLSSKCSRFCGSYIRSLSNVSTLPLSQESRHRHVNKWAWLYSKFFCL